MGEYFYTLFEGLPDGILPINAVREKAVIPKSDYPAKIPRYPSNCPYATVSVFDTGGNIVEQPQGPSRLSFYEKWPKGSRILVMVYDGKSSNAPAAVTIFGYGIIEIDGYGNGSGPVPRILRNSGNTAYGHAVKHNIPGADDEYLLQPSIDRPGCEFVTNIREIQRLFAPARLVGSGVGYGMAD
ncbi:MAG TPA: hypothetical protein VGK71_10810 [Nitrospirota bacterium]